MDKKLKVKKIEESNSMNHFLKQILDYQINKMINIAHSFMIMIIKNK